MNLLHIVCSPRGAQSESYRLSLEIIAHLEKRRGKAPLAIEKLNAGTLAHVDVEYADAVGYRVEPPGGPFDPGSLSQSPGGRRLTMATRSRGCDSASSVASSIPVSPPPTTVTPAPSGRALRLRAAA